VKDKKPNRYNSQSQRYKKHEGIFSLFSWNLNMLISLEKEDSFHTYSEKPWQIQLKKGVKTWRYKYKFMLDIGKEIEVKSGAEINFTQGTTRPGQKWITEGQLSIKMKATQLRTTEETDCKRRQS
jgi:hypothetical protein